MFAKLKNSVDVSEEEQKPAQAVSHPTTDVEKSSTKSETAITTAASDSYTKDNCKQPLLNSLDKDDYEFDDDDLASETASITSSKFGTGSSVNELRNRFRRVHSIAKAYKAKLKEFSERLSKVEQERNSLRENASSDQIKLVRRLNDLKEEIQLEKKCKQDVEVNYIHLLNEKDETIQVLRLQISLLKQGSDLPAEVEAKIACGKKVELQLKKKFEIENAELKTKLANDMSELSSLRNRLTDSELSRSALEEQVANLKQQIANLALQASKEPVFDALQLERDQLSQQLADSQGELGHAKSLITTLKAQCNAKGDLLQLDDHKGQSHIVQLVHAQCNDALRQLNLPISPLESNTNHDDLVGSVDSILSEFTSAVTLEFERLERQRSVGETGLQSLIAQCSTLSTTLLESDSNPSLDNSSVGLQDFENCYSQPTANSNDQLITLALEVIGRANSQLASQSLRLRNYERERMELTQKLEATKFQLNHSVVKTARIEDRLTNDLESVSASLSRLRQQVIEQSWPDASGKELIEHLIDQAERLDSPNTIDQLMQENEDLRQQVQELLDKRSSYAPPAMSISSDSNSGVVVQSWESVVNTASPLPSSDRCRSAEIVVERETSEDLLLDFTFTRATVNQLIPTNQLDQSDLDFQGLSDQLSLLIDDLQSWKVATSRFDTHQLESRFDNLVGTISSASLRLDQLTGRLDELTQQRREEESLIQSHESNPDLPTIAPTILPRCNNLLVLLDSQLSSQASKTALIRLIDSLSTYWHQSLNQPQLSSLKVNMSETVTHHLAMCSQALTAIDQSSHEPIDLDESAGPTTLLDSLIGRLESRPDVQSPLQGLIEQTVGLLSRLADQATNCLIDLINQQACQLIKLEDETNQHMKQRNRLEAENRHLVDEKNRLVEELRSDLDTARIAEQAMREEVHNLEQEIESTRVERDSRVTKAQVNIDQLTRDLDLMTCKRQASQSQLEELRQQLTGQLETATGDLQRRLDDQIAAVGDKQRQIDQTMAQLEEARSQLHLVNNQLNETKLEFEATQTSSRVESESLQAKLEQASSQLDSQLALAHHDLEQANAAREGLISQVGELTSQNETLHDQLAALSDKTASLQQDLDKQTELVGVKDKSASREAKASRIQIHALNDQLTELRAKMEETDRQHHATLTSSKLECEQAKAELDRLTALHASQLTSLQSKVDDLTDQLTQQSDQLMQEHKQKLETAQSASSAREGKLKAQLGEFRARLKKALKDADASRKASATTLAARESELSSQLGASESEIIRLKSHIQEMEQSSQREIQIEPVQALQTSAEPLCSSTLDDLREQYHRDVESMQAEHISYVDQLKADFQVQLDQQKTDLQSQYEQQLATQMAEVSQTSSSQVDQLTSQLTEMRDQLEELTASQSASHPPSIESIDNCTQTASDTVAIDAMHFGSSDGEIDSEILGRKTSTNRPDQFAVSSTVSLQDYEALQLHNADLQNQLQQFAVEFDALKTRCELACTFHANSSSSNNLHVVSLDDGGSRVGQSPSSSPTTYQLDHSSPAGNLHEMVEFEYLKNVLYQYMVGRQTSTLSKVLCSLMRFNPEQVKSVLHHEDAKLKTWTLRASTE